MKRFLLTITTLLILGITGLLGLAHEAAAQDGATLRVVVTSEEDGNAVIGANIMLFAIDDEGEDEKEVQHGGVTDIDGFHEFRNVESGRYQFRITYVGHKTHEEILELEDGERTVMQVSLARAVGQLDEAVVEADREVTTGEVGLRRITDIDVARIPTPGPGGDLASYIQTLPGVVMTGDRGGDFHIRGGTPTQNHILVDNLPVIKPFHISNLFSAFPQEVIQNVDMYAGGFGAEYLGATSAVIDVSLRPGDMKKFTSNAAISPYLVSFQAEGPFETDRRSYMFMARKSTINQTSPYLTTRSNPMNFYDLMGRYSFRGQNFSCNVTGMRTFDRGQINPDRELILSWANTVLGGRCLGYDETYDHPFEITLGYTGYNNSERAAGAQERSSSINQGILEVDLKEEFWGIPVDYGFGINFRFASAELAERFTTVESFDRVNVIVHGYGAMQWSPNDRFTLHPSLGIQVGLGTFPTWEPRMRLSYRPDGTDDQEISLAVGRYYQFMSGITDQRDAGTVFTAWKPAENEDPLPSALHGILGYQQRIGSHFKANLEGYVKKHRDTPVSKWTPRAKLEVETALADGLSYGFDARLEYQRDPIYLYLGYGWSKVEYEAASDDLGAWIGNPVFSYSPAHDQRHKFSAMGSYRIAGFTTSVRWEFGSGQPYTRIFGFDLELNLPDEDPLSDSGRARTMFSRPYGERLPTYHRLDMSVKKTFELSSNLSLQTKVGLINLYNRDNIFYFDLNTLQRVDQTPRLPYLSIKTQIN